MASTQIITFSLHHPKAKVLAAMNDSVVLVQDTSDRHQANIREKLVSLCENRGIYTVEDLTISIPVRETKKIFVVISCSSDRSPIIPCGWYGLDIPSFKSFVENVEFQATFIESVRRHQPREGYPIPATALRLILDGSASLERSYERVHDILFPSLRLETLILASQLRGLAGSLGYVSQPAKTVKPDDVRFVRCPYTQSRQSIEPSRHPLQRKETPKRRSRRSVIPARIFLVG